MKNNSFYRKASILVLLLLVFNISSCNNDNYDDLLVLTKVNDVEHKLGKKMYEYKDFPIPFGNNIITNVEFSKGYKILVYSIKGNDFLVIKVSSDAQTILTSIIENS